MIQLCSGAAQSAHLFDDRVHGHTNYYDYEYDYD